MQIILICRLMAVCPKSALGSATRSAGAACCGADLRSGRQRDLRKRGIAGQSGPFRARARSGGRIRAVLQTIAQPTGR